jgi:hypothetical protein
MWVGRIANSTSKHHFEMLANQSFIDDGGYTRFVDGPNVPACQHRQERGNEMALAVRPRVNGMPQKVRPLRTRERERKAN